jgi:TonB-linked SusC/RagA family outer membrane protein
MLYCYSKKCFTGIIILMLMLVKTSYAAMQDTTVSQGNNTPGWVAGTVVNQDNRTLKDVKIYIKDKNTYVKTDDTGHFSIAATAGSVLVFQLQNYNTTQVTVKGNKYLKVRMLDTYLQAPATVDVLYGSQSTESVIGAISTIYTNQLTTTPASLYVYALPGQLPGLYTQQTSGFANLGNTALTHVDVDGLSHVNTTSQNNRTTDNNEITLTLRGQTPVTIIDGVQREISSIDPESIESISVLKDALSTILLGINSSRGVLLVTTKKAEAGKPRISFTAESGIQSPLGLPKPLPAYEYSYLYNEALTNDGASPYYTSADFNAYKNHTDPYGHPDVNWFNTILRKNAPETSYKLNVDGGSGVAKYTIGISYFDQQGLFNQSPSSTYNTNSDLNRYIINSDVQVQVNKNLSVDLQLFGRVQQSREPGAGASNILSLLYGTPNNAYPIYNANGSFGGSVLGSAYQNNLLAMTEYSGYIQNNTNDILANLDLNYNLNSVTKGLSLKIKGNVSYQSANSLDRSLENSAYIENKDSTYTAVGKTVAQSNVFNTIYTLRQTYAQAALNYDRQFGKSNVTALLMFDTKSLTSNYDLSAVTKNRAIKAGYNYDGKYFIEGALNYSGYNRYTPGSQNGWFYAGGLGWQMGKESFIKDNFDWINSWKWRADYGKTGNNNVDAYSYYGYVQTYSASNYNYVYFTGTGRAENFTYYENPIANPFLSWETANKTDIGTDISLFKNHLQLTADYYHDRYSDLLQLRGASIALLGTNYPYENIGINLYHGFEFSATYNNNINKFNYFVTGNISTQASKVIFSDEETPLYPWNKATGLPVNTIFGYVADGFYQTAADAAKGPTMGSYTPKAGDIKLKDLNGDGVLNQFDQAPIGNLKPLVFYGATLGFNYQGFSFSVILQGVFNREISTNNFVNTPFQGLGGFGSAPQGQAYENATARWTPETATTAKLPERSFINGKLGGYNSTFSSFYLASGDYIRVKNAEIGYTLPYAWAQKLKFSNIRVFVNGENLFTLAGYGGYDPEVTPDAYPIQRVINAGISVKL